MLIGLDPTILPVELRDKLLWWLIKNRISISSTLFYSFLQVTDLHLLNLTGYQIENEVTEFNLSTILETCPRLWKLVIQNNDKLGNSEICFNNALTFHPLRSLDLTGCTKVN